MNEMIERATKALAEVTEDINGYSNEEAVIAVIKAMREPIDEMVKKYKDPYYSDEKAKATWRHMIDEILK